MHDTNAQTLIFIIFILIFFLAPSLLKLLGRYTLESKRSKEAPTPAPEETYPGEDIYSPDKGEEYQDQAGPQPSSRPIKPRWF